MSDRRTFLRGLAALPLIGTPAALASADPVFTAIERHRLANEAFEAAVGKVPDDQIDVASDVEWEARQDLHQAVPTTLAGLAAYVAYWEQHISIGRFTREAVGWEAIATIAEAMQTLVPGGARV